METVAPAPVPVSSALLSSTENVSAPSNTASLAIATLNVLLVSPWLKVSVPATGV